GAPAPDGPRRASSGLPGCGLAAVDRQTLAVEERRREIPIDRMRQTIGIGDHAVAHSKRALGRFNEPVHMVEALALRDAQALEQREDDQRRKALRRQRRIEEGVVFNRHREWLGKARATALQVGARQQTADAIEIASNLASDVPAIEVVESGVGELLEGRRERRLFELRAR